MAGCAGVGRGGVSRRAARVGRTAFVCLLCALVFVSARTNGRYLYAKDYQVQQLGELVRIFRCNRTPESLSLIYEMARPAYRYYQEQQESAENPAVEILPKDFASVRARLEHLPEDRRVLILFSHLLWGRDGESGMRELEEMFASRRREFVKIPARGALLYILPKKQ